MDINFLIHKDHPRDKSKVINELQTESDNDAFYENNYENSVDHDADDANGNLNNASSDSAVAIKASHAKHKRSKRSNTSKRKVIEIYDVGLDLGEYDMDQYDIHGSQNIEKIAEHRIKARRNGRKLQRNRTTSPKKDSSQKSKVKFSNEILPLLEKSDSAPKSIESFFEAVKVNREQDLNIESFKLIDPLYPKTDNIDEINANLDDKVTMVKLIHEKYVEPLLKITGYKWIRKGVPAKGRGSKLFSVKYRCSQENVKESDKTKVGRSRQLAQPLKEFDCESNFWIGYNWPTQEVEIFYEHKHHSHYKILPEEVKPFILERLDKRAAIVYNELMECEKFKSIRDNIHFLKVQSFWSKMRIKKKDEETKAAFKQFLNK